MTPQQKLDEILKRLKQMQLPDENTDSDSYWMEVTVAGENSTDYVCDMDIEIKQMIEVIES